MLWGKGGTDQFQWSEGALDSSWRASWKYMNIWDRQVKEGTVGRRAKICKGIKETSNFRKLHSSMCLPIIVITTIHQVSPLCQELY